MPSCPREASIPTAWRALLLFAVVFLSAEARAEVRVVNDVGFLEAGRTEKLDLYLPGIAPDGPPRPAVIWVHGGGFEGGKKGESRALNVCGNLAAAGYVCASIDYRLGDACWPTNLFDCKNAVRFLRVHAAEYRIDPAKIAIMGGSSGGYLAQMVGFTAGEAALEPDRPYPHVSSAVSAVGNFYGMSDYLTRVRPTATGALTDVPIPLSERAKMYSVPADAGPAVWRAFSPVAHITAAAPPVLIVHGLADAGSDYAQAVELSRVLSDKGVPNELVMLANVGHEFDLTTWQKKPLPRDLRPVVIDFLRSCGLGIGSAPKPVEAR